MPMVGLPAEVRPALTGVTALRSFYARRVYLRKRLLACPHQLSTVLIKLLRAVHTKTRWVVALAVRYIKSQTSCLLTIRTTVGVYARNIW